MIGEIRKEKTLSDELIDKHWVQPYVNGDPLLILSIDVIMQERSENFKPNQIQVLDELIRGLHDEGGAGSVFARAGSPGFAAADSTTDRRLEEALWEVDLSSAESDIQVMLAYVQATSTYQKAYHTKFNQWRSARNRVAKEAAESFWAQHVHIHVMAKSTTDLALKALTDFTKDFAKVNLIEDVTNVGMFPLLNWVAPCTLTSSALNFQVSLLSAVLAMFPCAAAVLTPMFTYKKGSLWRVENTSLQMLDQKRLMFDQKFYVQFEKKHDKRETRPLTFDGRLVTSKDIDDNSPCTKSQLWQTSNTDKAKQLVTKDMQQIEDVTEGALPAKCDPRWRVTNGNKWQQLGEDASVKLLQAFMTDVSYNDRCANVVVDLNMDVGDNFDAFLQLFQDNGARLRFWGLVPDEVIHPPWSPFVNKVCDMLNGWHPSAQQCVRTVLCRMGSNHPPISTTP